MLAGHVVENREVRANEDRAISEARELPRGDGDRARIPVESKEPASRCARVEDAGGVPAPTDRAVQIPAAFAENKLGEYFGQKNRLMKPPSAFITRPRGP